MRQSTAFGQLVAGIVRWWNLFCCFPWINILDVYLMCRFSMSFFFCCCDEQLEMTIKSNKNTNISLLMTHYDFITCFPSEMVLQHRKRGGNKAITKEKQLMKQYHFGPVKLCRDIPSSDLLTNSERKTTKKGVTRSLIPWT